MALSRKEVLEQYNVDRHGLIRDHGKFEREPLWVPALWDAALEGGSDEDFEDEVGQPVSVFFLDNHDYKEFPELKDEGIKVVVLWEQDNGFVNHSVFATEAAYEKARQEMEESRSDEDVDQDDDDVGMTADERANFRAYLRDCTDRQVQGVYDKEKKAGRRMEMELALAEAERRGIDLET